MAEKASTPNDLNNPQGKLLKAINDKGIANSFIEIRVKSQLLALVYRLLQALAIISLNLYFRKIVFIGQQNLRQKGPTLILSNHPNTAIDPLIALMYFQEKCYLLANYSLFKNPISGAILRTLFCIPVQRVQDVDPGQPLQNTDAFKEAEEHLQSGRNIYMAPEGTSYAERHIRQVKTGFARIVLSAEEKMDFKLQLKILPIGITYYDGLKFGSDVVVEVGKPISADAYQNAYAENPRQAVNDLTDLIENELILLTTNCESAEEDRFLKKLEIILQHEIPLDTKGGHGRSKKLIAALHDWQKRDTVDFDNFKTQVETYFSKLAERKLNDQACEDFRSSQGFYPPLSIMGILAAFPAFLAGLVGNFIPAWLSNKAIRWLNVDEAYDTTIRLSAGLIAFPLYWWSLCEILFWGMDLTFLQTLVYIIVVIGTGLVAGRVYTEGGRIINFYRFRQADRDGYLTGLRQAIVEVLRPLIF